MAPVTRQKATRGAQVRTKETSTTAPPPNSSSPCYEADEELRADLVVGLARGDQTQNLQLAVREAGRVVSFRVVPRALRPWALPSIVSQEVEHRCPELGLVFGGEDVTVPVKSEEAGAGDAGSQLQPHSTGTA